MKALNINITIDVSEPFQKLQYSWNIQLVVIIVIDYNCVVGNNIDIINEN